MKIEPHHEKTWFQGFQPGPTQTRLYRHRRWLKAQNFGFIKKRDNATYVSKTKALISCAGTAQLICALVFVYSKSRFSHDMAQLINNFTYFSIETYLKIPKISDARKLCCNLPKIQEKRPNLMVFSQKDANGIANSEDPDQTAPLGAV